MARRPQSALGELPDTEPRFPGVGYSHGSPSQSAPPPAQPDIIQGSTRPEFVTTTAKCIASRNVRRATFQVQNRGSGTVWLSFGASPGDYSGIAPIVGIELAPGAFYELPPAAERVLCVDVYAVADNAQNLLSITEGVFGS